MKIKPGNLLWSVVATIIVIGLLPLKFITVTTEQGECLLHGDRFALRWRHSVEHQLWYEHYQRQGDNLHLYQTWLQTFGAGTPSQGDFLSDVPQGYIGYKQHIDLPEINWTVSRRMEGTIFVDDWQFPVYQTVSDYSVVKIKPARSILASFLLRKYCND